MDTIDENPFDKADKNQDHTEQDFTVLKKKVEKKAKKQVKKAKNKCKTIKKKSKAHKKEAEKQAKKVAYLEEEKLQEVERRHAAEVKLAYMEGRMDQIAWLVEQLGRNKRAQLHD